MEDVLESLLFFDELTPRRRTELRRHLEENRDLAEAFDAWKQAHRVVRRHFRDDLPARRLLVLYALDESGRSDLLDAEEREALQSARPEIEAAVDAHPAMETIVETIQDEAEDFDATWAEHGAFVEEDVRPGDEVEGVDTTVGASPSRDGRREDRDPRSPSARGTSRFARRVAAGALLLMAAVIVWFVWPSSPQMVTVSAAEGEIKRVNLVDGSTVRLAGAAEMQYEEVTGEAFDRQISLNYGRAFFDIQEQKRPQPFVVQTPTATATVLGTQFGVTATSDSTDVVLASGKVEVGAQAGDAEASSVVLNPGQHSRVRRGEGPSAPASVDVASALAWSGLFVFRATPVDVIADRLGAFYDVSIAVDDALRGEPVTGTFDQQQPPEQILDALASTLGASVEGSDADGYRLTASE